MENAEADCRQVLTRLYLYLDGEIGESEVTSFEGHLHKCLPCHQHADLERDFKEIIRRKCSEETLPDGLIERVRAQIREHL